MTRLFVLTLMLTTGLLTSGLLTSGSASAQDGAPSPPPGPVTIPDVKWEPVSSKDRVKSALDKGCNFLIDNQREDGAYGFYPFPDVGITSLVLHALAESHRGYRESDGPYISRAVEYVLSQQQKSGGIHEPDQGLENYKTSMAILALTSLEKGRNEPFYAEQIVQARDFVAGLQCDEGTNYDRNKHKPAYGGIGYGGDRKPDMSNTHFAIEALKAAGLSEDSEEFKRALVFLERCQNIDSNDLFDDKDKSSTGDGGMMYSPGSTKAGSTENADGSISCSSYGSMTYAGLKSYLYAGLTPDDPRVAAAWKWIQESYTVEHNPGMVTPKNPARGWQGLFYYYMVMARTLDTLGVETITTPDGVEHRWAEELAGRLIALQASDGSWVNPVDRWWEGDKALVTAYAVRALGICYKHLD